jgi:hypothetical protein
MANVDELWQMATDLYARGQSSNDPSMKQRLMRAAHDYLKQAEEVRRGRTVIRPSIRKIGQGRSGRQLEPLTSDKKRAGWVFRSRQLMSAPER